MKRLRASKFAEMKGKLTVAEENRRRDHLTRSTSLRM